MSCAYLTAEVICICAALISEDQVTTKETERLKTNYKLFSNDTMKKLKIYNENIEVKTHSRSALSGSQQEAHLHPAAAAW